GSPSRWTCMNFPATSPAKASARSILKRMKMKLSAGCNGGLHWRGPHDRARIVDRLPAATQRRELELSADRFDGEQLLGHPAHDPRSGFCHPASADCGAENDDSLQRRFFSG